jgi:hypothetical protein
MARPSDAEHPKERAHRCLPTLELGLVRRAGNSEHEGNHTNYERAGSANPLGALAAHTDPHRGGSHRFRATPIAVGAAEGSPASGKESKRATSVLGETVLACPGQVGAQNQCAG